MAANTRLAYWIYLSSALLLPCLAKAQEPVTCSFSSAAPALIRNEGQTEQVGDYFFTCTNASASQVHLNMTVTMSAPVTSLTLVTGIGGSEAAVAGSVNIDEGTVSGNTVTFANPVVAASGTFSFDITNIRVDATSLSSGAMVTEAVSISGTNVNPVTFPTQEVAVVDNGIASSITNVTNYGAGTSFLNAVSPFTIHFGEGFANAFKTQGSSTINSSLGSSFANNTETGYYILLGPGNVATSGTRVRVVLSNIPTGVALYAPISISTDQLTPPSGPEMPLGAAAATAGEAGPFSELTPVNPQPTGYSGTPVARIPVTGGTAEVVYEIMQDSASSLESYTVPFYLTGNVPSEAGNVTAIVSFAPVNSIGRVPDFAQLSTSTSTLNASQLSLTLTTSSLPVGENGVAYAGLINSTGGTAPYTYSLTSGTTQLQALGLNLNQLNNMTGEICCTPTSPGTVNVGIRVTDAAGAFTSLGYTVQINQSVSINTASLPNGAVNEVYSTTLTASSGVGTYSWSVSSGSLPAGLTLNSGSGLISGTPTTANTYNFSITVTDGLSATFTRAFTVTIFPALGISTTSANIPVGVQGLAYAGANAAATNGSGGYGYSISTPAELTALTNAGMTFNATGQLGGTPNTTGTINFHIKVTDEGGGSATTGLLTLTLNPPISFVTTTLPNAEVGVAYSTQLQVTGGSGQYIDWLLFSGAYPNGSPEFDTSATGVISGTPIANTAGTYQLQIRVQDAVYGNFLISSELTLQVNSAPSITTTLLPAGQPGTPYPAFSLTATGGSGTYSYSVAGLPPGVTLTPAGLFGGTPTTTGTFSVQITVTDSAGGTGSTTFPVVIDTAGTVITSNLLPGMTIVNLSGRTYGASGSFGTNQSFWDTPFSTSGPLLEYTVQPGTYTIRAIDPADALAIFPNLTTAQQNTIFTAWTYNSPYGTAYLAFDSSASTNTSLTQIFSGAEPGTNDPVTTPPAFSQPVCAGEVSNGLAQDPACGYAAEVSAGWYREIHNGPGGRYDTAQYTYTFANQETLIFAVPDYDLSDNAGGVSLLIAPAAPALSITTSSLPSSQVNTAYSPVNLAATGGNQLYNWSATGLPAGLSVTTAGVLSGTPTASGTFSSVAITVTDPISGMFLTQNFSLTINPPPSPLTITTTSLMGGYEFGTYNQTVAATGGIGSYTWSIASGSLPTGLSINSSSGQISGMPTATGTFTFHVEVMDSAADVSIEPFSVTISPQLIITTSSLPNAVEQLNYNQTLTASGGSGGPYTWSLSTGSLPTGLNLSSSGSITGIPTNTVPQNFEVQVTDSTGNTRLGIEALTVNVSPVSYVLLNAGNGCCGLVRVSADGSTVTSIDSSVGGYGIAQDNSGNYIVAAGNKVQRVVPSGAVTTVANAPSGSNIGAVAVDSAGNIIAGDNYLHQILRISPDGQTITTVASYPVSSPGNSEDLYVLVDVHGNYIVAEDNGGVRLFSITPAGSVTPVTLTGPGALPSNALIGGLTFDQNGNYILQNYAQQTVSQITPAGTITQFAGSDNSDLSIARNPLTNSYVLAGGINSAGPGVSSLNTISSTGSVGQLNTTSSSIVQPTGIIAQTSDFVSSVIATNPLGYFRLEALSASSEVGSSTYTASSTGTSVQTPGAPITTPGNHAIAFDGSTGQVTTTQTGGITTAGSIMAWVNLAQLPSTSSQFFYIAGESQVGNDFDLQFDPSNALTLSSTTGAGVLSYTPQPGNLVGQWHFVVATFDATAGTRALYWDGNLVASDNIVSFTNKTTQFNIGASSVFPGRNFNGQIDEVAVWNYAITAGQVYYLYESGGGIGSSPSLISLNPASIPAGSNSTTLTINGSGLEIGSNVQFTSSNGVTSTLAPNAGETASQFTVLVPIGLFVSPGIAQVTISNPFGFPTNQLPFTITPMQAPVNPPPPVVSTLTLSSGTLPQATPGQQYNASVGASGGTPPYTYSASGFPSGIGIAASTGAISGATTQTGTFTVNIQVTDSASNNASAMFTLTVAAPPAPAQLQLSGSLPQGSADEPYSAGFSASGGVGPYTYSGSGFPPGIGINSSTGAVGGQTAQTGSFTVTITTTDSTGATAGGSFTLTIVPPPPVSFTGASLGPDVVETPFSVVVSASGGVPPYSYSLAGGAIPAGVNFLSSGALRGTPLKAGPYTFTAKATDSTGGSALATFTLTILPPPLTINAPSPLASGVVTMGYPTQTLSATGGTSPYTFTLSSGALPAGLTLSTTGMITGTPTAATPSAGSSFTVMVSDSSSPASTGTAALSIAVQPLSQNTALSAGSFGFALSAGASALPPAQTLGVQSTIVSQPVSYSVAVVPASATWLSATSGNTGAGGTTPGSVSIGLTQAAFALADPSTPYSASVVVTCTSGACNGTSQSVPVTLTVSSPPPQLSVQNTTLSFSTTSASPQTTTESLVVSNVGGGGIGFESIACGAPWCTVSGTPSSLLAGASATLTITANPAGLAAGYYYTSISIASSAGSASIPVTLSIAPNGVISLGPAGTEFTLPQGGLLAQIDSFLVEITGTTPVSFTAAVQPGAPWLTVIKGSGMASGSAPATVTYGFNESALQMLTPGPYYGTILVTASGASNSPQSFEVVLNVTPPTTPAVPNPTPGGLIFLTQANATPPAQTATVYSFSITPTGFQASASTSKGGNWLSVTPTTGSTTANAAATVSVSANPSGLSPGVYKGEVNFAFSAAAVRSINVTLIVENTGSATTSAIHRDATGGCTPSQLVPTSTGLVSNFAAPAAWPVPLGITLVDDCGNLINNGQIVATFSNGDPALFLTLADPTVASYIATWTPEHSAAQITITAQATAPSFAATTAQIAGAVTPNNAPILADLAIANFFNPIGGAPLAPGALVQITGQYLSGLTMNAPSIPLPLTLAGTSVIIGGLQAPISMVSPGQVNAQVPFELPAGQPYQVIVNANNALTTPQNFQAGAASPGLGVLPSGYVQAGHGATGAPITETAPAKPGEIVSVYLVGMGSTTIPVASGQPGPSGTFATTTIDPVLTLNGENTTVSFSGLIPGLVGVYQVNFQVPSDAPNGDLTLSLIENAFTSNSGLLPVHN